MPSLIINSTTLYRLTNHIRAEFCCLYFQRNVNHAAHFLRYVSISINIYMQGWQTSELLLKAILTKIRLLCSWIHLFISVAASSKYIFSPWVSLEGTIINALVRAYKEGEVNWNSYICKAFCTSDHCLKYNKPDQLSVFSNTIVYREIKVYLPNTKHCIEERWQLAKFER